MPHPIQCSNPPSRTPHLTKLTHELPKIALGRLLNILLQLAPELLRILPLDPLQMQLIPMDAHDPRNQQLIPQLLGLVVVRNVLDGVVDQQRVARGLVDDAVEDVRDDFALRKESV